MNKRVLILLLWIMVGSAFTKGAVDATERVEEARCKAGNESYCLDPSSQPQCVEDCPIGNSDQPETI